MNKVKVHFDRYNFGCFLHIQKIYTVRIFKKVVLCFQYIFTVCRASTRFGGSHTRHTKVKQSQEELQMQNLVFYSNNSIQKVPEMKLLYRKLWIKVTENSTFIWSHIFFSNMWTKQTNKASQQDWRMRMVTISHK